MCPQYIWLIHMKVAAMSLFVRAEEQFAQFVFKTKMVTDWQTSLGL